MSKNEIPKMPQKMLWEEVRKIEKGEAQSSELMKRVAMKAPSRKKIMQDFPPAEQVEIFKRIGDARSDKKSKKKAEAKETSERRALIRKIKKIAKEMEDGNKGRIIIFPSYSRNSDKLVWYKLADFSAMYYKYRMAERMGRVSPRIYDDKDRFYRMKHIASISNIDKFIDDAMKLDEFDRHEETIDKVHILCLKTPLTDNEVVLLERTGEIQKEMMHNVLRPKKAAPDVYLTILMLGCQVMKMVHKLEVIYRYEIGDNVARQVGELLARRGGKRKTMDTHGFEVNLFENLVKLRDALRNGIYYPSRGTVHVIFEPVQREIFAAPYVDRILHHWIVGTIMKWQENRLIYDSYSCREGKGTLFGIKRLQHHILSVSQNMKKTAYVVQLDLSGYFMHIRRDLLYDIVKERIDKQFPEDRRDKRYMILLWAVGQVIFDDPTNGVRLQGSYRDWRGLPDDKSLMMQPAGQGMVIGNYTSQTFSNIYLDPLDRFITLTLGYKHYGRYVDVFYMVMTEDELPQARRDIKAIETFVVSYGLSLNKKKTKITEVHKGVKFLGVIVRGFRLFPCRRLVKNFRQATYEVAAGQKEPEVITSYLGMFSHLDAGKIIARAFDNVGWDYVYDKKQVRTRKQQKVYKEYLVLQKAVNFGI